MYGKSANINLNESSADKGMIVEYAELLDTNENDSISEALPQLQSTSRNNTTPVKSQSQFDIIDTEPMQISTKSSPLQPALTPTKAIHKQIETRRADGKRRITPMFIPLSSELEAYV